MTVWGLQLGHVKMSLCDSQQFLQLSWVISQEPCDFDCPFGCDHDQPHQHRHRCCQYLMSHSVQEAINLQMPAIFRGFPVSLFSLLLDLSQPSFMLSTHSRDLIIGSITLLADMYDVK